MNKKALIITILTIGVVYRLFLTSNGNFLFNMDNARDMVDVREMVALHKFRLTGPTSAIEGLFNGPAWYYLLAIPFVLSGGDPYGSIIMEIILWAIGGFFLLKLVSKWGSMVVLSIGLLWVASNYVVLTNLYAFNPNPVTLLTPLFIFLIYKYLNSGKLIYSIGAWFLGGLFFNFEMNFGIFIPAIILTSLIITRNTRLFKDKGFWIGIGAFTLTLLPQILFDLRHQFIMSRSVIHFLSESNGGGFNPLGRVQGIWNIFYDTFQATMMNQKFLSVAVLFLSIPVLKKFIKNKSRDNLALITFSYILVPFMGYLLLPVSVNPWHLGGPMAASLIVIAFLIYSLWKYNFFGRILSLGLSILILYFSLANILHFFLVDFGRPSSDPSLFKNETTAIDYVYIYAKGANFKVYTYLPSVYDYPYQYLFWWYGKKQYGYIPGEYGYSPNKPQYISNKEKFEGSKSNFSGLVFLIKEPDRIKLRQAWENDFKDMQFISKDKVGPLEIEIRKEL